MKSAVCVALVVLSTSICANEETSLASRYFSYSGMLDGEGNGILKELVLPESVYLSAQTLELRDVRVINQNGEWAKSAIKTSDTPDVQREAEVLSVFTIEGGSTSDLQEMQLHVTRDADGSVVSIVSGDLPDRQKRIAYLVDNSESELDVSELQLSWEKTTSNFLTTISVEGSDDLLSWQILNGGTVISQIDNGSEMIVHDSVELKPFHYTYMRITWRGEQDLAPLVSVSAVRLHSLPTEIEYDHAITLQAVPDKIGHYQFALPAAIPMRSLVFTPQNSVNLYKGGIYSRSDNKEKWHVRRKFSVHTTSVGQTELNTVKMASHPDRFWKLEFSRDSSFDPEHPPAVSIRWIPAKLVFVAEQGDQYRLLVGHHKAPAINQSVGRMILDLHEQKNSNIDQLQLVDLSANRNYQEYRAIEPFPWEKSLLWFVLILGIAIMMWMVRSLARQLSASDGGVGK